MAMKEVYSAIAPVELLNWVNSAKREGWQFVQMCAAKTDEGFDLVYSLRKGDTLWSRTIMDVTLDDEIPSITDSFLSAFVFENEANDLFGLHIKNIAIDFAGKFYNLATDAPMSVVTPEFAAKKAKVAKAKAAKQAAKRREAEKRKAYTDLVPEAYVATADAAAEEESAPPPQPVVDMGDVVAQGGDWWPTANIDPTSYRAPKVVEVAGATSAEGAAEQRVPGEVEEGGDWWPRAVAAQGKEA